MTLKDVLEAIKDALCGTGSPPAGGVKQIVGSTAGELSQQQKDDCAPLLRTTTATGGQDRVETILDPNESPSFVPPSLGGDFTAYDATGKGTNDIAADLCQQACDAYDDECEENHTAAARMTRRLETTIIAFRLKAGMVE